MLDASFYRPAEDCPTQKSLHELESRAAAAYARWQQLEQPHSDLANADLMFITLLGRWL